MRFYQSGTPNPDRVTPVRRTRLPEPPLPPRVKPASDADRLAASLESDAIWHRLEKERLEQERLYHLARYVEYVAASLPPERRQRIDLANLDLPAPGASRPKRVSTRDRFEVERRKRLGREAAERRARTERARKAAAAAFKSALDSRPVTASSGPPRWKPVPAPGHGYYDSSLMSEADAIRISRLGR